MNPSTGVGGQTICNNLGSLTVGNNQKHNRGWYQVESEQSPGSDDEETRVAMKGSFRVQPCPNYLVT